jgi:hypothetical protein
MRVLSPLTAGLSLVLAACLAVPAMAQSQSRRLPERPAFTETEQNLAVVPGMPDVRFWADSEPDFLRALPTAPGPWLIFSGGGADGAFGAGLLNGWSQVGTRPNFALISGVSSGGLISTYAFLGSSTDEKLREQFTNVTAADIFEVGGTPESLLDTWPLKSMIAKQVTPEFLAAIAAEHRKGRRLFVTTTNLDAERAVTWNMGAIAAHGSEAALKLFRDVLLSSASLPGMFPPGIIETESKGQTLQEIHAEGGLTRAFFIAPDSVLARAKSVLPAGTELYVVLNSKVTPDFFMTERSTVGVLARSIAVALKAVMRSEAERIHAVAKREGIGFNVAYITDDFTGQARSPFDSKYMQALFDWAVGKAKAGAVFHKEPPK